MGNATHVVKGTGWDESESSIERLGVNLRGKHGLGGPRVVRGVEQEAHHRRAGSLAARLGQRRHPGDHGLGRPAGRKCDPAGSKRLSLALPLNRRQGDDAFRVVRIGDAQVGSLLLFDKDPAANLERGREFFSPRYLRHDDPGC